MMRLKAWRFALGWPSWRDLMNTTTHAPYQIVEESGFDRLTVRMQLIEGGRIGMAGAHRDAARRIVLEMTEAEAIALAKGIRDRVAARQTTDVKENSTHGEND